jgi:hypothetical protein
VGLHVTNTQSKHCSTTTPRYSNAVARNEPIQLGPVVAWHSMLQRHIQYYRIAFDHVIIQRTSLSRCAFCFVYCITVFLKAITKYQTETRIQVLLPFLQIFLAGWKVERINHRHGCCWHVGSEKNPMAVIHIYRHKQPREHRQFHLDIHHIFTG